MNDMPGFVVHSGYLAPQVQNDMVSELREMVKAAPLFSPVTRWGKPMSVRMTSAGKYGWFSDRGGYRYEPRHPNGKPWPAIPESVLAIWHELVSGARPPDCCLINFYRDKARMGLHVDADEADFSWPVLSISLGDSALFRIGGLARSDPTRSLWLHSGDVVLMGGEARKCYHGVDRIRMGSSRLLTDGGRINLTLRVVD